MYKSRQKAIGVAAVSVLILSAFAVGSWAIIDASYKNPRGDAKLSYYSGITQHLNRGGTQDGSLNINSLSINDWINLNMPTKVLFEKNNSNGFDGYYYTFDDEQKAPKTKDELKKLNDDINAKAFIAKISFSIESNSYFYSVSTKDFLNNKYVELGSLRLTFTDSNFTKLTSISSKTPTSNFEQNFSNDKVTIGSYSLSYNADDSSSSNKSYTFNVTSNVSNSLFFGTTITPTTDQGFSIKNLSGGTNTTGNDITSTYSQQKTSTVDNDDTTTSSDHIIYDVRHSSSQSGNLSRANYMSNWRVSGENQFAKFHLPNEIGLFPTLTPFGVGKKSF